MTKLKELLRPKSLVCILSEDPAAVQAILKPGLEVLRRQGKEDILFEEISRLNDYDKKAIQPIIDVGFYNGVMLALQEKDPQHFDYIVNEMRAKGGDADIDIRRIERTLSGMKESNQKLKVYGPEIRG